jgi:succinate dehydrogenase / fumarate reductase cytochrome b subunit
MAAPPIFRTSIGKKVLMAASGLVLILFVIAHMLGNLKAWLSAKELNAYSEFLRRMGEPIAPHSWVLWIVRIIVFVAFVVHIYLAIDLSLRNRRARQVRYARTGHVQANPAAITMRWGGLAIALFVVFHLANFTWGWIHPDRHGGPFPAPVSRNMEHVPDVGSQQSALGPDHPPERERIVDRHLPRIHLGSYWRPHRRDQVI